MKSPILNNALVNLLHLLFLSTRARGSEAYRSISVSIQKCGQEGQRAGVSHADPATGHDRRHILEAALLMLQPSCPPGLTVILT